MSERNIRYLDPQAVEAAEYMRKTGNVIAAAEIAATALGAPYRLLHRDPTEIMNISFDPEQRAVLACLARIHVDSLKTAANQTPQLELTLRSLPTDVYHIAKASNRILDYIGGASETVQRIYRHTSLTQNLHGIDRDHRGREHHFLYEMPRDNAKLLAAATPLFEPKAGEVLIELGETILERTYNAVPDSYSVKYLIGVEVQMSKANRGAEWNKGQLMANFAQLAEMDREENAERVATVSSWLISLGERTGDTELQNLGTQEYGRAISKHPEYSFMLPNERRKQKFGRRRQTILRTITPFTTRQRDRARLHRELIGNY